MIWGTGEKFVQAAFLHAARKMRQQTVVMQDCQARPPDTRARAWRLLEAAKAVTDRPLPLLNASGTQASKTDAPTTGDFTRWMAGK